MNRGQQQPPVCQYFLRGNCRFGPKCRFSHVVPAEKQLSVHERLSFNNGGRGGGGGGGGGFAPNSNRFSVFGSPGAAAVGVGSTGFASPFGGGGGGGGGGAAAALAVTHRDHTCDNRPSCWVQIKEDLQKERPMYWRLTCYSHWKYLPNDVVGDISFEELRWEAYTAWRQQGQSFPQVVARERILMSAKENQFSHLLQTPYKGPAAGGVGGGGGGVQQQPSPPRTIFPPLPAPALLTSPPNLLFGKPVANHPSATSPVFPYNPNLNQQQQTIPFGTQGQSFGGTGMLGKPMMAFGVGGVGGGVGGAGVSFPPTVNTYSASSGSGFQSLSPQPPFGTSRNSIAINFGSMGIHNWQQNQQPPAVPSRDGPEGFGLGFFRPPDGSSPFLQATTAMATAAGAGTSMPSAAAAAAAAAGGGGGGGGGGGRGSGAAAGVPPTVASVNSNGTERAQSANDREDIWMKDRWSLGEIPEEEPPVYARF